MTDREKKVRLIHALTDDLMKSIDAHEQAEYAYSKLNDPRYWENGNYRNPNHGKGSIEHKIVALRRELLNYSQMISHD